jgi:hypothetical protein
MCYEYISLVITAAPRYMALARTAYKTPLPIVLLLLRHVAVTRTA